MWVIKRWRSCNWNFSTYWCSPKTWPTNVITNKIISTIIFNHLTLDALDCKSSQTNLITNSNTFFSSLFQDLGQSNIFNSSSLSLYIQLTAPTNRRIISRFIISSFDCCLCANLNEINSLTLWHRRHWLRSFFSMTSSISNLAFLHRRRRQRNHV